MKRFIKTERLILRTPESGDEIKLLNVRNSPFVLKYNLYPHATLEDLKCEMADIDCVVLQLKGEEKLIGCIYIKEDFLRYRVNCRELAAWLDVEYAKKGYMSEAGFAIMHHLFENEGVERLTARVFSTNAASCAITKKLGFVQEGYLKDAAKNDDGEVFDLILYSVTRQEFERAERK